ncbi:hypothetical protein GCM10028775_13840 [Catellatospora paridis]
MTTSALTDELKWSVKHIRQLIGDADTRPTLNLLAGEGTGRPDRLRSSRHLRAIGGS